jgi:hypothetical protein
LPRLESKIDLFDNTPHKLVYIYKKGGYQILFLDGNELVKGRYNPTFYNILTGNVVYSEDISLGENIEIFNRQLSLEELKK